jgi:hypothetical protein
MFRYERLVLCGLGYDPTLLAGMNGRSTGNKMDIAHGSSWEKFQWDGNAQNGRTMLAS